MVTERELFESVQFLLVRLDGERSVQKKGGYRRRIDWWHFVCCCPHKQRRSSTLTKNTRPSHASWEVHWGWRWDFRTFPVNCNKFVNSVNKICHLDVKLKLKLRVRNFCFVTTIHNAFVFTDSNKSISLTIQN